MAAAVPTGLGSAGRGGPARIWGGGEELRAAIERHGCDGAVRICHQAGPENDCYRILEEECERYHSEARRGPAQATQGESPYHGGSRDWEPGPHL